MGSDNAAAPFPEPGIFGNNKIHINLMYCHGTVRNVACTIAQAQCTGFHSNHVLLMMRPKEDKEAFYRGHAGAPRLEVACLTLCLPFLVLLGDEAKAGLRVDHNSPWLLIAVELAIEVLPHVALYMGMLPPHATCAGLAVGLAAIYLSRFMRHGHPARLKRGPQEQSVAPAVWHHVLADITSRNPRWLSGMRGGLMLCTCIAILAVDFRAFPRRFAKAEVYGTGLMDMGVGSIVLVGGLTAAWRTAASTSSSASGGAGPRVSSVWSLRLLGACLLQGGRRSAACWVLWAARLTLVKSVDYQEHVGEYGVHWNFFATVAVVTTLSELAPASGYRAAALATLVTAAHQAALSWGGLGTWAASEARDPHSLLSLNKEGVVSVAGFWAIHLWGCALGHLMYDSLSWAAAAAVQTTHNRTSGTSWQTGRTVAMVVLGGFGAFTAVGFWLLAYLEACVEPVSRRLANAAFIVWTVMSCLLGGVLLIGGELVGGHRQLPDRLVMPAASRAMLPTFLAANLMTGCVNLALGTGTMAVEDRHARAIVAVYMAGVCAVAVGFSRLGGLKGLIQLVEHRHAKAT